MKVTKEDVDKASAALDAAYADANIARVDAKAAVEAADFARAAAWNKYIKLKEEYENGN